MSSNFPSFVPPTSDSPLAQLQAVLSAAGSAATGTGTAHSDQAMIFNLASAIAMNSLMTMNQQQGANPVLANAAKLWLSGISMMNPQANSLLNLMNGATSQAAANPLALLTAGLNGNPVPEAVTNEVPKKVPERTDRKRTLPAAGAENPRKRVNPLQPHQQEVADEPTEEKSEMERKIENRLTQILNEEIYNIFDSDEVKLGETPPNTSEEDSKSSSDSSSQLTAEMTLLELIDYVSGEESPDPMQSVNSAFRKVSARADRSRNSSGSPPGRVKWGVSLSPPDSSPTTHSSPGAAGAEEELLPPLSPGTLALIREVAGEAKGTLHEDYFRCRTTQLEKTPTVWRGQVQMKTNEATVQLHLISGQRDFVTHCLGPLVQLNSEEEKPKMRINQRMRTESQQLTNVLTKLQVCGAACLCVPIGVSKEDASRNNQNLKTHFLEYFTKKGAAGIASMPATATSPASLVYVFPPSDFSDSFMSQCSLQLYNRIKHNAGLGYLFVVVLPADEPTATTTAATPAQP